MTPVLPIEITDGLKLDVKQSQAVGAALSNGYRSANPFPHIVLDDFLPEPVVRSAVKHFPVKRMTSDVVFDYGYVGHHKRQILPEDCDGDARSLFNFFNSQPVIAFLEALTGIDGLIADPHFTGGGYHEIGRGGKLGIHADFRIHSKLHLQRRLNMIIYLNENWKEEYGGCLELWDRKMTTKVHSVLPIFDRCVIFNTDADSFHGHPDPLQTPDDVMRRSMALYYYTASRAIHDEVPDKSTVYRARPTDDAKTKRYAWSLRSEQFLRDWVPPALIRFSRAVRRRLGR
jgi:hypothetical protein